LIENDKNLIFFLIFDGSSWELWWSVVMGMRKTIFEVGNEDGNEEYVI
jgi:hypothetical protein